MSRFRFILNGTEVNNAPMGWDEFTESFELDSELWGFVLKYEGSLTFGGDGYQLLNNLWLDSVCKKITMLVKENCGGDGWVNAFEGILSITDIDYNLHKCTAEIKTTDASWFGKIHNDRQIPINLQSNLSKGGASITPCDEKVLRVFNPAQTIDDDTMDYSGTTRKAFDHVEALAYCLSFVTDGDINTVESDYLSQLSWDTPPVDVPPDFEYTDMSFMVCRGLAFRDGVDAATTTTIEEILETLHKKFGLWWYINDGVFRIEPMEYWLGSTQKEFLQQPDLIRSIDTQMLYAKLVVGSEEDLPDNKIAYSVPYLEFLSHDVQEYILDYKCNTDAILDLVSKMVYSSNIFERMLVEDDQQNDQQNMYVQAVYVPEDDQWRAVYTTEFLRPDGDDQVGLAYNPFLFNDRVIRRHILPAGMFIYEADSDDNIKVALSANETSEFEIESPPTGPHFSLFGPNENQLRDWIYQLFGDNAFGIDSTGGIFPDYNFPASNIYTETITPVPYNDEILDENNNWNDAEYEFTAPALGVYGFRCYCLINKFADLVAANFGSEIPIGSHPHPEQNYLHDTRLDIKCRIERYDPSDQLQNLFEMDNVLSDSPNNSVFTTADGAGQPVGNYPTPPPSSDNLQGTFGGLNPATGQNNFYKQAQFIPQEWENDKVQDFERLIYMNLGDKIKIRFIVGIRSHFAIENYKDVTPVSGDSYRKVTYGLRAGSFIETNFILSGGADFTGIDPKNAYNMELAFDRPITLGEWNDIKGSPENGIGVGIADTALKGYVKKIERTFVGGQTTFTLRANRNDNSL